MPRAVRVVKEDLKNTRVGKYLVNRKKGMNKKDSAISAGYPDGSNVSKIENSKSFQLLEQKFFKDEIMEQITLKGIAFELVKNINQDEDKGAKNNAIKIALDKLEPPEKEDKGTDQLIVILK
jgi:hypothetical protein